MNYMSNPEIKNLVGPCPFGLNRHDAAIFITLWVHEHDECCLIEVFPLWSKSFRVKASDMESWSHSVVPVPCYKNKAFFPLLKSDG